ncbi:hypothetical protein F53441_11281 [Fusarium austroafricanum]|uniref:2EXR domain-containing protein n=1 Tax=Fusarium austroafricanum TaxID=2364996 RepID=A0A8H4K700_9HYPO|nr:hypothetical protein F53441_11281 [Fusarium austroafricanum]
MSTAGEGSKAPPTFSGLPGEIRLMIWEFLLPPRRDLTLGCRIDNTESLTDPRLYTDFGKIVSLTPPERYIAKICHESRQLFYGKGSLQASSYSRPIDPPAYVDWHIGTVFMSLRDLALLRFSNLRSRVDNIATLWPEPSHLENLHHTIKEREAIGGIYPVKIIYIGISAVQYEDRDPWALNSNVQSPLYGEGDFRVFELNDHRVPGLLDAAWTPKRRGRGQHYHRSTSCFLEHLKQYWEEDNCAKKLRSTWETLVSEVNAGEEKKSVPILKPAIVFSQTRPGISYGTCHFSQIHRWEAGLLFQRENIFEMPRVDIVDPSVMENTPADCQGFCRGMRFLGQS